MNTRTRRRYMVKNLIEKVMETLENQSCFYLEYAKWTNLRISFVNQSIFNNTKVLSDLLVTLGFSL